MKYGNIKHVAYCASVTIDKPVSGVYILNHFTLPFPNWHSADRFRTSCLYRHGGGLPLLQGDACTIGSTHLHKSPTHLTWGLHHYS